MMQDSGVLRAALAAAVGDDPALIAELRAAFLDSATGHADALARARTAADWRVAAWRLQGLAASFGAVGLMVLAERAAATSGDVAALREIRTAVAEFGA